MNNDIEQTVSSVLNVLGFFYSSQPWFVALKSVVTIAIATVEVSTVQGGTQKEDKKKEALKQIDKSCNELGIYKMVDRNIVMTLAGPVIDAVIWALNTFVPGWDKTLKAIDK